MKAVLLEINATWLGIMYCNGRRWARVGNDQMTRSVAYLEVMLRYGTELKQKMKYLRLGLKWSLERTNNSRRIDDKEERMEKPVKILCYNNFSPI